MIGIYFRGAYNLYNYGDDLILFANLKLLEKIADIQFSVSIDEKMNSFQKLTSEIHLKTNMGIDIIDEFNKLFNQISLPKGNKSLKIFYFLTWLFFLFALVSFRRIFRWKLISNTYLDRIEKTDIIHYISGGYFYNEKSTYFIYEWMFLKLVRLVNPQIKIIGTGLGVGPIRRKVNLFFLKQITGYFNYLSARDSVSEKYLKGGNFDSEIFEDDTLLIYPLWRNAARQEKHHTISLNLKDFPTFEYSTIETHLESCLLEAKKDGYSIIYFSFGQPPGPDDLSQLNKLHSLKKIIDKVYSAYSMSVSDFIDVFSKCIFSIGSAYHFAYLNMLNQTMSLIISSGEYYQQKICGITPRRHIRLIRQIDFNSQNIVAFLKEAQQEKQEDFQLCKRYETLEEKIRGLYFGKFFNCEAKK